jgi:hypothetical protein
MRLFGLLLFCVTLLSAQGSSTRGDLDEAHRKLQNEIAQTHALAEDLTNEFVRNLTKALEAAKASGDVAKSEELAKALETVKALANSNKTPISAPLEAAKSLTSSISTSTNSMAPSAAVWSYMLLRFTISDRSLDEVDQLNMAGQRGFELVSVVQAGDERLFYLKRRLQ